MDDANMNDTERENAGCHRPLPSRSVLTTAGPRVGESVWRVCGPACDASCPWCNGAPAESEAA